MNQKTSKELTIAMLQAYIATKRPKTSGELLAHQLGFLIGFLSQLANDDTAIKVAISRKTKQFLENK